MNLNLMWRYWAAREMADKLFVDNYELYDTHYWGGNTFFSEHKFINALTQILKKEWFR